jgi:N-acetyl-anhydromuramyl-L-alanine amidase AmpD
MEFKIVWKGNEHTNKSSRGKNKPFVIVNHISGGTMSSMDNWFTTSSNQVSSAHFGISKDGKIHQYVKIEDMAWHAGIKQSSIKDATAKVVRDMKINPNLYSVGIEHEGYDGSLTPAQFQASVWLHKYIKNYIKKTYNKDIPFDNYHIIGHFQIDPVRKSYCPGPKFPWKNLYTAIQNNKK